MKLYDENIPSTSADLPHPLDGKEQMHAEVERVTYRNDENGWTVLRVRNMDDHTLVTVTGTLPPVQDGEHLQMIGHWSSHTTYGRQFKADRAVPIRPTTRAAILRYLCSGIIKGIGDKTAEKIVGHFGLDTFKILDQNPGCLLQIPKLGKRKSSEIIESWKAQKSVADVMMFLNNHGITLTYGQKIMRLYGEKAIEIISSNPYQLAVDINGIGFIKADTIAKSIGIAPDSPERIRAATIFQVQQAEERGHCFQTTLQITELLQATLGLSAEQLNDLVPGQLALLASSGSLLTERMHIDGQKVTSHWRPDLMAAECNISGAIARLLKRPLEPDSLRVNQWIARYNEATTSPLSESQAEAVRCAASSRVFILTGGPGVGKTTTANAIIRLFKAMGKTVLLTAPTGRAAQRLGEVSSEKACTIHRLLEWQPAEAGFARNESNPLKADVIVCDESSMLDVRLADALLSAAPEHAQVVFIGDVDQLPSVGPGNVLRDMINSERVPCTKLREIFRQAATSSIIRHAHEINEGIVPSFVKDVPTDCQFIEVDTSDEIRSVIHTLLTDLLPKKYKFDPIRDVQILTPMNRGDLGTQNLNNDLQELLNPDPKSHLRAEGQKAREGEFRAGDKVIQTANNYDLQVFNGDIGFVTATNVDGGKTKVVFADGRMVTYDREQVDNLRLAYAITIHKSQGSEFPVVILPTSMQHYVMLQRNLIYTGLTRARKLAIFIGAKKAVAHAVRNNSSTSRQTYLAHRIQQDIT
jgi:exodeoxyribonuclease V alpha subunit